MKKIILLISFIFWGIICLAQKKIIVIDPGHNYDNISTLEPIKSACEVMTNWDVANKLKNMIDANLYLDWIAVLTRPDNNSGSNVTLTDRALIANNYEAIAPGKVYFLSIHCNAGGGTGTETFYCNHTFNSNNSLLIKYAQNIQDNMVDHGNWYDRSGNRNGGVEEDFDYFTYHLGVLKNLTMPNCLNEIGFVDYFNDELKLWNDSWRSKFAFAYFEALQETFGDLNVLNYSISNLPCYANNSYYCKINVTIKNITTKSVSGDLRAMLRHFPMNSYETPSYDFCQLGTNKSYFLAPDQELTFSFDSNIPLTIETGMALCIESKPWGEFDWKKVHMPSHREILKVPLNGALVKGIIYNNFFSPLQGAEMWSYQKPIDNSKNFNNSSGEFDIKNIAPDFYDPTVCLSGKNGEYELLIPSDWGEAVVSVRNYMNFDEVLLSPIENISLSHFYTTTPIIIGCGSGSGYGYCGLRPGQSGTSVDNPINVMGFLKSFEKITLNGQEDFAFICSSNTMRLGVIPLPQDFTEIWTFKNCGHSYPNGKPVVVYLRKVIGAFPLYKRIENCNWFGFDCEENVYFKFFISLIKCNNKLEYISEENTRWFEYEYDWDEHFPYIEDIDFNDILNKMNIVLHEGDIYKLKLASLDPDWTERSIFFYVLSEDEMFDNNVLSGNYYSENISLKNESISSNVTLVASKSITILPNSLIGGTFKASIDKDIQQFSCTNQMSPKSSEIIYDTYIDLNVYPSDYIKLRQMSEKLTVQTFSDVCKCKNKLKVNNTGLNISPNPTTDYVNIELLTDNDLISKIELVNLAGQLIDMRENVESIYCELSLTDEPEGTYIARVYTLNGEIYTVKVVKAK